MINILLPIKGQGDWLGHQKCCHNLLVRTPSSSWDASFVLPVAVDSLGYYLILVGRVYPVFVGGKGLWEFWLLTKPRMSNFGHLTTSGQTEFWWLRLVVYAPLWHYCREWEVGSRACTAAGRRSVLRSVVSPGTGLCNWMSVLPSVLTWKLEKRHLEIRVS